MVEHGIHLGLTGIVAGADGVDIGLLHQFDVAKHGGHVDGTSVNGVRILRVDALEEDALSVDIDEAVLDFHCAETVFGCESLFFVAFSVELGNLHGVEVRRFR